MTAAEPKTRRHTEDEAVRRLLIIAVVTRLKPWLRPVLTRHRKTTT